MGGLVTASMIVQVKILGRPVGSSDLQESLPAARPVPRLRQEGAMLVCVLSCISHEVIPGPYFPKCHPAKNYDRKQKAHHQALSPSGGLEVGGYEKPRFLLR